MSQIDSVNSGRSNARLFILTVAAVALAIALPLLIKVATNQTRAEEVPGPSLTATLTGAPIAGQTPHGGAAFFPGGTNFVAHLFVEIDNVNLAADTHLNVFVNAANVGVIVLDDEHHGFLFLPHSLQDPPPVVHAGDVMSITPGNMPGGNAEVLGGTFAPAATPTPGPTHTPFPSPTHSPFATPSPHGTPSPHATPTPRPTPTGTPVPEVHLYAPLTGPPIGGVVPRGIGIYESGGDGIESELDVYVSFVNLNEGTQLGVFVAGTNVGSITLHNHMGALHVESGNGETLPIVMPGDTLVIRNGETSVLSGVFSPTPPPEPTPTPRATPSPHGTPTPHATPTPRPTSTPNGTPMPTPTPRPAHVFSANLSGDQVVPPVTTDGRGHGFILLNHDETEIHVFVGFRHLSSAVTAVTINGPAMPGANGPVIFTLTTPSRPLEALQTFPVTAAQVAQLRANLWYFLVSTTMHPTGEIRGQIHSVNHRDDFDGDGISDVSVMRAVEGGGEDAAFTWYIMNSGDNSVATVQIGRPGDINVQGDYDGDGIADVAMFTPSTGMWELRLSATGETANRQWGMDGDIPVVGDYDGDGINDLAVFRPSTGIWYIQRSIDGAMMAVQWGMAGDRPVAGDFDGDGSNDLAVFRPSTGDWYINRSSDGGMTAMHWGMDGDRPVAGDFDGDGMSDVAVFRPSEGNWYINRSSDNTLSAVHFGLSGDIPVPCEFDVDGTTDIAVFRPSDGNWYILHSSDNTMSAYHFGMSTDRPITTAYAPE
jgi:hypothetical protein